jgi:argininosuccinate lyase
MNKLEIINKEIEEMRTYNDELYRKLIIAERHKQILLEELKRLTKDNQKEFLILN